MLRDARPILDRWEDIYFYQELSLYSVYILAFSNIQTTIPTLSFYPYNNKNDQFISKRMLLHAISWYVVINIFPQYLPINTRGVYERKFPTTSASGLRGAACVLLRDRFEIIAGGRARGEDSGGGGGGEGGGNMDTLTLKVDTWSMLSASELVRLVYGNSGVS